MLSGRLITKCRVSLRVDSRTQIYSSQAAVTMDRVFYLAWAIFVFFSWRKEKLQQRGKGWLKGMNSHFTLIIFKRKAGLCNRVVSLNVIHSPAILPGNTISVTHIKIVVIKENYSVSGRTSLVISTA